MRFELTEDHIKLLSGVNIRWTDCEYGAPAIDCKRPFGNSGENQILSDMEEILGSKSKRCPYCSEILEATQIETLRTVYKQLETALDVILNTGKFQIGTYVTSDKYGKKTWTLEQ